MSDTDDGFEEWWRGYYRLGDNKIVARDAYTAALARQSARIEALEKVRTAARLMVAATLGRCCDQGGAHCNHEGEALAALESALADPALGK